MRRFITPYRFPVTIVVPALLAAMMPFRLGDIRNTGFVTLSTVEAATSLPAIDAALAAQASDKARKDWDPNAELVQISATTTEDGVADGALSSTPVSFIFRADGKGYQITLNRYGDMLGAPSPLPPHAIDALPISFISLKEALALARVRRFSQTGILHPVLQSFTSADGLRRTGWLFAAPGAPLDKQIFVTADGHQTDNVQHFFGSLLP